MINYSIIIPHKNCWDLLCRCVSSIPARSDIEVMIIDDNSTTFFSEEKLHLLYPQLNLKVFCLHESKFAGGARNVGLVNSTGKWLVFADADDFFADGAFDIMDNYIDSEHDIIFFAHTAVYSDTLETAERLGYRLKYISEYVEHKTRKSEDYLRYLNHSPTSKMTRRKIVEENNLKFDEVPAANDAMFSVTTGYYARSIDAVNQTVYVATIRRDSITQTRNKTNDYSRYSVDISLYNFFRQKGLTHLYPFVTMRCINALRHYGVKEFYKYISLAYKHRVNIFLGITRRYNKKYKY